MLRRKFLYGSALIPFLGQASPAAARQAASHKPIHNIVDYGAEGSGKRLATRAIEAAIGACVRAGGGAVYVPPGRYLTGAIGLQSNVTLYLESGAVLLGSKDPGDYPLRPSPWPGGARRLSSLIYGEGLENVTVAGRGTIDGQGLVWWNRDWLKLGRKNVPVVHTANDQEEIEKIRHGRPHLVNLVRCKNVLLEGVTLTNSPSWTLNPVFCDGVTITGLRIVNPVPSPNTDGIDPESCRNVHISDCYIDVGDDCIAIKSGKNEVGRKVGMPCENITITNLTTVHGHAGVAIGSEMSGGVRNVSISNCTFNGTERGIRIKSRRGRGNVVEGIVASNISMRDVPQAISITMFYGGRRGVETAEPVGEGTPQFRHIYLSNIAALRSKSAGEMMGLKEMPLTDISLENVVIDAGSGLECENLREIGLHAVQVNTANGPSLRGTNIEGLELDGFRTGAPHENTPVVELNNARDIFVRGCRMPKTGGPFLSVRGPESSEIVAAANDFPAGREAFTFRGGASRKILTEK